MKYTSTLWICYTFIIVVIAVMYFYFNIEVIITIVTFGDLQAVLSVTI